jgi:excisionase family DNA binding protein
MLSDFLNAREASTRLGYSESYTRKLLRNGIIPGVKAYSTWHIPVWALGNNDGFCHLDQPWRWESVEEAAARLGVCKSRVRAWVREGALEAERGSHRAYHIRKGAMPGHTCNASL